MKTNVTYVDAAKFETLIVASGLPHVLQKGFVKVQGARGRAVYVAATKRVGRVDVSGFEVTYGVLPHCGPFGNVHQQLNFAQDEAAILKDFEALLADLAAQAPVEKTERKTKAPKGEDDAKGWSEDIVAKKAERKALIQKVAKEKGAPISEAAFSPLA